MTIIFNDIFKESFGTTVNFRFKNYISVTKTNLEQRIAQWDRPLMTFDVSREVITQDELEALLDFHQQQKGIEKPFLYLDPFDNYTSRTELIINNIHITNRLILVNVEPNKYEYQLSIDTFILQDNNFITRLYRKINYPFNLRLFLNGYSDDLFLDWDWDAEKKVVVTSNPLTSKAVFNYYVPVRFGEDEIEYQLIGYDGNVALFSVPKLTLIEVRETYDDLSVLNSYTKYASHLNHDFYIDGFADSNLAFQSNSLIEETDSGFEKRINNESRIFNISLGDRLLTPHEVLYLIYLYRLTRGSSATFNFTDIATKILYKVRFNSDFSLKVEKESDCGVYASFSSLSLVEVQDLDKSVNVSNYTLTQVMDKKFDLYYGFTSANGAEYGESKIYYAGIYSNTFTQNFIGGGNVAKTVTGHAYIDSNDQVVLAPNQEKVVGSCFVSSPLPDNFDINNFTVYFNCKVGKDGLAFVIHGQSTGANAIGVMASELGNSINYITTSQIQALTTIEGKSLGYVGIAPSIAIELDCFQNEFDLNGNHIGVNINGSLSSYVYGYPDFSLQDADCVHIWIDYTAPVLRVFCNNSPPKPSSSEISTNILLREYLGYYYRNVPVSLPAVEKGVTANTLCYCWKITRKDGVIIRTTNHDKDIMYGGDVNKIYKANAGFASTAIALDYELSVDNSEIKSFFSNDVVSEKDIISGKYDKAVVEVFLVNWITKEFIATVQKGIVGQITYNEFVYTLELRNIFELLTTKNTKKTSSNCPLIFGETGLNKCNKSLIGLQWDIQIDGAVISNKQFSISPNWGFASGFFDYGTVKFLSGDNNGLTFDIYSFDGTTFTLWETTPFSFDMWTWIQITKGCEKSLNACKNYNNVANFGGDPFVPGADTYLTGALEYSNPID